MKRGPETDQLGITYRDPADTRRIAPGDRAPDAPLKNAAGEPVPPFDLLCGPHPTLLCSDLRGIRPRDREPAGTRWSVPAHRPVPAG
ncbi:hypothetical protein [Nocardia flavorosea]|uniref:hypothetical protein n=1 Tax=Nocardia flavorosea TaxID=53429 RepID=UPI0024582EF3|nr:hypothetical protein [Nocardia flavorosea]